MKRILISLLALALCAAAFPLLFASAQDGEPRRPVARPEKSLDQLVRKHERLKLDTAAAVRRVRAGRGLLLSTPEHKFELDLTPNDLRAPDYRAEATDEHGVRRPLFESAPVRTYKGNVRGQAKALARFTVDDETIEGMILTPEDRYYVEPLSKYEPAAGADDFVLYKKSDIIEDADQVCGTMDAEVGEALKGVSTQLAATTPEPSAVVGMLYEAEIATEADYAYFTKLGASAAAVNAEIMSTMNQVDGVYEAELNISFKVVYQHVWTGTPADTYPYGVADGTKLIERFANYWNANFTNVHRDLAHLWTGQNLVDPFNDPNLIGIANPGTVCGNPQYAYAVSERLTTAGNRAILAAHEIGHNFGATHQCSGTIMNSFLSGSKLTFCSFSRAEIASFLDFNGSSCLAQSCSPVIAPAALAFPAAGGTGSVSVATGGSCSWTAKSNVAWIVVNSGASGSGNKTVGYTVAANPDPVTRTGTLTVAGKTHTVTQGPATVIKSLTLTPANVAGGKKITGTVYLSQAAPAEGAVITLSDNLAATTVPATVTIPAGAKYKTFSITTVVTTTVQSGAVTASYNGITLSAALTVRPAVLTSLTLSPGTVPEGSSVTATLTLDGAAPPTGAVVTLSDTLAAANTPASFTIPSGATTKSFLIPTTAVSASQTGAVKALYAGVSKSAPLTVRPLGVSGVALTPGEVVGGGAAQGLVVLEGPAPKDISVSLTENLAGASVPATVVVPAGSRNAAFTLTTTPVTAKQTGVLTAAAQGIASSAAVVVNKPPVACSTLSFAAPKALAASGPTYWVVTADFNGDGKLDLAGLTHYEVSIYLGTGTGAFGAPTNFHIMNSHDMAVADFNQDGKHDLVIPTDTKMAVLLGDGTGKFGAPIYSAITQPVILSRSIAVGDFNGDGRPDVATTNGGLVNISVLPGDGRGGFGTPINYRAGAYDGTDLAAGDFNADGKPDLARGTRSTTVANLLLGTGAGSFSTPRAIDMTVPTYYYEPRRVAVGDFNKDGKQDLAFTGNSATAIVFGDGKGSFGPPTLYTGVGSTLQLLVKDMNGDGNEDLISLNGNGPDISILLGDGTGKFAAPFKTSSLGWAQDIAAGDFNGDGKLDLAATDFTEYGMVVKLSTCK